MLRPFLDLIRHEQTSSTLTGASLEAVQSFLEVWPWQHVKDTNAIADAVSDIVDAVSQCRFQETNAESDQNVIVMVVHVLHAVVMSQGAAHLSDHSMWQLVESLYALSRAHRNDVCTVHYVLFKSVALTALTFSSLSCHSFLAGNLENSRTSRCHCARPRPISYTMQSGSSLPAPRCTPTRRVQNQSDLACLVP